MDIFSIIDFQQIYAQIHQMSSQWITTQMTDNHFLIAAVFGFGVTALLFILRWAYFGIKTFIHKRFTTELTVNSDFSHYWELGRYLYDDILYHGLTRSFTTVSRYSESFEDTLRKGVVIPGYGIHFGFFQKRLVIVRRHLQEKNQSSMFMETMNITMVGIRPRFKSFVEAAIRKSQTNELFIYSWGKNGWSRQSVLPKRTEKSLHVGDLFEKAKIKIEKFTKDKARYERLEIPYHLGIVLTGKPGTGKSSFVVALANTFKMNVARLNLDTILMASDLEAAIGELPSHAILVIEDIDTFLKTVNMGNRSKTNIDGEDESNEGGGALISLGTLLNLLDGISTPDGMIVVATTNHPEKLDPALLRKGRFDLRLDTDYMAWDDLQSMAKRFFDKELKDIEDYIPLAPVDVQEVMVSSTNIDEAREKIMVILADAKEKVKVLKAA